MLMVLSSCVDPTTFEVKNGTSNFNMYDVKVYEYTGSDVVGNYDIGNLSVGASSGVIEAEKDAEQVKIAFKFFPEGAVCTTVEYFSLTKNKHTMILLDDDTQIVSGSKSEVKLRRAVKE